MDDGLTTIVLSPTLNIAVWFTSQRPCDQGAQEPRSKPRLSLGRPKEMCLRSEVYYSVVGGLWHAMVAWWQGMSMSPPISIVLCYGSVTSSVIFFHSAYHQLSDNKTTKTKAIKNIFPKKIYFEIELLIVDWPSLPHVSMFSVQNNISTRYLYPTLYSFHKT